MSGYHTTALKKAFREILRVCRESPTDASLSALIRVMEQIGEKESRPSDETIRAFERRLEKLENISRMASVTTFLT
jgi:hypothetical protein